MEQTVKTINLKICVETVKHKTLFPQMKAKIML